MSRKIIDSRAREIIIQVDNYFIKEKDDTKVLLQSVTRSLRSASDISQDVVIPKPVVIEILNLLQNKAKVTKRVISATGVAKNTVAKLRREKEISLATGSKIKTPTKRKRGKKEFLDSFSLSLLRNIIHSMYTVSKELPTMRRIMAAAKQDLEYKGSESTLRQIMKTMLGYRFKKCCQKLVLIERPNIKAWRARYLRRMKENDLCGADKKTVIYIGETSIHAHYTVNCWQSDMDIEVKKKYSPGCRWIIVHAGSVSGFVNGALLMFKADTKTGDYHDQMNPKIFTKWLEQKLLPNTPPNSIIVMDNAPYHSKEENKPPNRTSKKQAMVEWLQAKNITFSEHSTKPELYLLIKKHKPPKQYIIDKLLTDHGHEVVRLPPYNCDLNPIEYIWNSVKQRVSNKNMDQLEGSIQALTLEALESITSDDWKKEVNHVKWLEEDYRCKDQIVDELTSFVFNTENDSDSETTDSEKMSESDVENMSGIEEWV